MEISLDALVGVQRHGQDLADRLAHGLSDLLQLQVQPPQLPWSPPALPLPLPHKLVPFDIDLPSVGGSVGDLPAVAAASFVEFGDRLGQAGSELGASVGGAVQGLARRIPVPFHSEGARRRKWEATTPPPPAAVDEGEVVGLAVGRATESGIALERVGDRDALEAAAVAAAAATGSAAAASASGVGDAGGADGLVEEDDGNECEIETLGNFKKAKGTVNVSAAYNTRHHTIDSSAVARGDIWRVETSRGDSTYGNGNAPLFLIQLGPLLFVRDSTLLLPVHLSKQHLLWYGYDRKNGVHSLCPAIWSKHRKWLLMSMMCLNPVACSFMDVQFPNGQLTYVAGEGITATGFFPLFGGLLQAHGKCPGETKLSFSFKSKRGTRFTPTFKWPDNSLSFGIAQAVAWKKSGLMVRPSIQVSVFPLMNNLIHETTCTSVCPTFGGSDPGIRAEFVHSLKEELNVMCGFSCSRHPSAFTSLSLGRSKWNGQVGSSGVVTTLETPLDNMGRPSLSVQLNAGVEF